MSIELLHAAAPITSWARKNVWHRIQVVVLWALAFCLASSPMYSRGLNKYYGAMWLGELLGVLVQ